MAVYSFYANESDGYIASTSATYATARAGTGTLTVVGPTDGALRLGQQLAAGTYSVWQSFISFDTSGIPEGVPVLQAQLQGVVGTDNSTTNFTMEARIHDWGTTLETTDFVAGADLASKPLLASFISSPGAVTFTSAAGSASLVNTTGRTSLVLASSRQGANTAPTNAINEYLEFRSADFGAAINDPKLTVVTAPYANFPLGTNTSKTTGTTLAITTTNAAPAGDSIFVALAMDPSAGTVSATDSAGNTYTVIADATNGSGTAGVRLVILAAHGVAAMAAASTITVTHPSAAARAVIAQTFIFADTGTKVTGQTATGSSTAPSVNVKSPVLHPLILSAVAVEGPLSDVYTNDATYLAFPTSSAGTDAGGATTNVTVRIAFRAPVDETDYTFAPTLGTSRLWAAAAVVLDTVDARIRTFVEAEGMRTAAIPGESVVDTGIAYNPSTGFATKLHCTIMDPALTIYYGCVVGGTTYGGTMSYGETVTALPASTVGVVIDAEANVSFTGLTGDLDLRVPA